MGLGKALYQKWVKGKGHFLPYSSFATPEENATLFSSLANRGGSVCLASNRRIDVPENVGGPASYAWATCSPPETVGKKRGAGRPIRPGTTALPKPCAEEDVSRPSPFSRSHSTVSPQVRSALAPDGTCGSGRPYRAAHLAVAPALKRRATARRKWLSNSLPAALHPPA